MAIRRLWISIIWHFFKTSNAHRLDAAQDSRTVNFSDLPLEVIGHIASFLPVSSAAALALCNHKIQSALGTQYWKSLGSWREGGGRKPPEIIYVSWAVAEGLVDNARSDFLSLLDRDLPEYIFCRRCALLHLPTFNRHSNDMEDRFCTLADIWSLSLVGIPYQIRFSLLQWTMKRYRAGLNCSKELKYFFEESFYRWDTDYPKFSKFMVREARICSGKVLIRAQDWFLVPASHTGPLTGIVLAGICPHLWHREEGDLLTLMMDCKFSHLRSQTACATCDGLRQCCYCHAEFQIGVKDFGQKGLGIAITTWVDLGECRTPLDPKWALRNSGSLRQAITGSEHRMIFEPGSIREVFGDGTAFLSNSILTSKQEKALLRLGVV